MKSKQKKLVLFDIDGTLIAGDHPVARKSVEFALKTVFGLEKVTIDWKGHYGGTDRGIMTAIAQKHGQDKKISFKKIKQLAQARFEYFSTNMTPDYGQRILPGAKKIIRILSEKKHIILGVLTGNFEKVGKHKLKLMGIDHYFKFGIFGDLAKDRNELARNVFRLSKKKLNADFKPEQIIIIGDTPRDIKCAKAINAKVIGVTTGSYSEKDLLGADLIVNNLNDKRVLKLILQQKLVV